MVDGRSKGLHRNIAELKNLLREGEIGRVPIADPNTEKREIVLEGYVPSVLDPPKSCPFAIRCPRKLASLCDDVPPPQCAVAINHAIARDIWSRRTPRSETGVPVHSQGRGGIAGAFLAATMRGDSPDSWSNAEGARSTVGL